MKPIFKLLTVLLVVVLISCANNTSQYKTTTDDVLMLKKKFPGSDVYLFNERMDEYAVFYQNNLYYVDVDNHRIYENRLLFKCTTGADSIIGGN